MVATKAKVLYDRDAEADDPTDDPLLGKKKGGKKSERELRRKQVMPLHSAGDRAGQGLLRGMNPTSGDRLLTRQRTTRRVFDHQCQAPGPNSGPSGLWQCSKTSGTGTGEWSFRTLRFERATIGAGVVL